MIVTIMLFDAIGYINCFFVKNSCSLFSILLFVFSSFVFSSPNSARYCNILSGVLLLVVFGHVGASRLLQVGMFLSPFERLFL